MDKEVLFFDKARSYKVFFSFLKFENVWAPWTYFQLSKNQGRLQNKSLSGSSGAPEEEPSDTLSVNVITLLIRFLSKQMFIGSFERPYQYISIDLC